MFSEKQIFKFPGGSNAPRRLIRSALGCVPPFYGPERQMILSWDCCTLKQYLDKANDPNFVKSLFQNNE